MIATDRKPPVPGAELAPPNDHQRARFSEAMGQWLSQHDYRIGLSRQASSLEAQARWAKCGLDILKKVAETSHPMLLLGGANDDKVLKALEPFTSMCDLFGHKVGWTVNNLILLIYSDHLTTEDIDQTLRQCIKTAGDMILLAPGLNGNHPWISVCPILVYFDDTRFDHDYSILSSKAAQTSYWHHVYFRLSFVSIPTKKVSMPRDKSIFGRLGDAIGSTSLGKKYNEVFRVKWPAIDEQDLRQVLTAAGL